MSEPEISVIMPAYNEENHIKESIESIINQTFDDFEFIIINDGSTDSSQMIIEKYASQDSRIISINQENIGLTLSLNKGIRMAGGKYVARQDAGDISFPERLEKQYKFMQTNKKYGLIGTDCEIIDDNNKFIAHKRYSVYNTQLQTKLLRINPFSHGTLFCRRDILLELRGYNSFYKYAQDLELILRAKDVTDIFILPEILYKWRYSKDGISSMGNTGYGERARENYLRRKKKLPENYLPILQSKLSERQKKNQYLLRLSLYYFSGYRFKQFRNLVITLFAKYGLKVDLLLLYMISLLPRRLIDFIRRRI